MNTPKDPHDKFVWTKGDIVITKPRIGNDKGSPKVGNLNSEIGDEIRKIFKEYLNPNNRDGEVHYSARHAPKGGVTIGGTFYTGGEWIPSEVAESSEGRKKLGDRDLPGDDDDDDAFPDPSPRVDPSVFGNLFDDDSTSREEPSSFLEYKGEPFSGETGDWTIKSPVPAYWKEAVAVYESVVGKKFASIDHILAATGMPDGADVEFFYDANGIEVLMESSGRYKANRAFEVDDDGKPYIVNNSFTIDPRLQGNGWGSAIFAHQVEQAAEQGFDRIETYAVRNDDTDPKRRMNGYYTWPLLGYDAEIPVNKKSNLPPDMSHCKTLSELYSIPGGRDWWKVNGSSVRCEFDLKDGSKSRQILANYIKSKENRP